MKKELLLLRKLYTNPELTQREMAKVTGISLGSVNGLIKKFLEKGMVDVKKLTSNTLVYNLTSIGLKKKAELSYKYIVEALSFCKKMNAKVDEILQYTKNERVVFVLFGDKDEIYEFIEAKFIEKKIDYESIVALNEIKLSIYNELFIIVWNQENINKIKDVNINYLNLLDSI